MSNFLSSVMTYAEPWSVIKRESLADEAGIEKAVVIVSKEYGTKSVAFFMKSGGFKPVPLDREAQEVPKDTELDINTLELLTLKRGDETCQKVHIK